MFINFIRSIFIQSQSGHIVSPFLHISLGTLFNHITLEFYENIIFAEWRRMSDLYYRCHWGFVLYWEPYGYKTSQKMSSNLLFLKVSTLKKTRLEILHACLFTTALTLSRCSFTWQDFFSSLYINEMHKSGLVPVCPFVSPSFNNFTVFRGGPWAVWRRQGLGNSASQIYKTV